MSLWRRVVASAAAFRLNSRYAHVSLLRGTLQAVDEESESLRELHVNDSGLNDAIDHGAMALTWLKKKMPGAARIYTHFTTSNTRDNSFSFKGKARMGMGSFAALAPIL